MFRTRLSSLIQSSATPNRSLQLLIALTVTVGVLTRLQIRTEPRDEAWIARETQEREEALEALIATSKDNLGQLLEATNDFAETFSNPSLLRRAYEECALRLRNGAADDDEFERHVKELETQLEEWDVPYAGDITAIYRPNLFSHQAARLNRRREQVARAMQLARRAVPGLPLIVLSSLLSMLCGTLEAARFYYQNEVLTRILQGSSARGSWTQALRMLLVSQLLSTLASIARAQAARMGRQSFIAKIKVDLFAALVRQDVEYFETHDLWEARHLIGNAEYVCSQLLELPVTLAEGVSRVLASGALLASQSPALALLMLLALPSKQLIQKALDRLQRRAEHAQGASIAPRGAFNTLWASLVDPVALKTMRAYAREPTEVADFQRAVLAKDEADAKGALAYQLCNPARDLVDRLLNLLGVWYGGRLVGRSEMRAADLPAFVNLAEDTFDRARYLYSFVAQFGSDVFDPVEKMMLLLEHQPRIGIANPPYERMSEKKLGVEFRGVVFAYPNGMDAPVLRGVDFKVEPGERVGVMGESGCGKSTLFSLLIRLYEPTRGHVLVGGTDVRELNPLWLRERVVLVSQTTYLARRTVRENLLYARERAGCAVESPETLQRDMEQALEMANCAFFLTDKERFPRGLQTDLGVNASKLSGGERQRLALARALLARPMPRILLLDEHTSALDENSQRAVQMALDGLWRRSGGEMTILAIAHRLSNFRGMDRVIVLSKNGVVAEQGPPREILQSHPNGIFAGFVRESRVEF